MMDWAWSNTSHANNDFTRKYARKYESFIAWGFNRLQNVL